MVHVSSLILMSVNAFLGVAVPVGLAAGIFEETATHPNNHNRI